MISRIYVWPKEKADFMNSYLLVHNFNKAKLENIAAALTNPVLENFAIDKFPHIAGYDLAVEIGFKPGVTDNVAHTIKEMIRDMSAAQSKCEVYSSRIFFTQNKNEELKKFISSLYNPLIERAYVAEKKNGNFSLPKVEPKVILQKKKPVISVNLELKNEELIKIGKEGIQDPSGERRGPLALDLPSLQVIRDHFRKFKRDPNDIELESLAQTWSEHCKHTIFADPIDEVKKGLYKTFIKGATEAIRKKKNKKDFCVSVFSDNSGGIAFDDKYLITHKVETHNSPSALDPYGGAITGIVGVNRDTIGFGLGAKPVANVYGFCFGNPEDERRLFRNPRQKEEMLSPRRIMDGVIKGVNVGGNCSGIPTLSGFLRFDDRYRGKPLVFAGTVGIIPRKINGKSSHAKSAQKGDYVVMLGGKVGLDGIHGATFSSVAMDQSSPATAVQIGDPITQKKLSDALVKEARDLGLYHSITDNGAGGLSCSVAEMAKESGGAEVDLEKVPLKYPGLLPWEIWISESQERMTLAVPSKNWKKFKELMEKRGVEATVIGKFTGSGKCIVRWHTKKIMDIDMEFLHDGLPKKELHTSAYEFLPGEPKRPKEPDAEYCTDMLQALLREKNIGGFAFISEQYDHEVQASSVVKPLSGRGRINTDAQVFRPVLSSPRGAVLTASTYPSYGDISTYHMAACAIDTAVRNVVAAGGKLDHLAILDNFCWCSSTDPMRLGQLKDALKACYEYATGFETPFISGKDSMFNDFKGYDEKGGPLKISIPPTLLISGISVMPDFTKAITPEWKHAGDTIYLLGETNSELGGSEYFKHLAKKEDDNAIGSNVPNVDLKKNLKIYRMLENAIEKELIASALSISSGGLGIALAKASLGGLLGAEVSLADLPGNAKLADAKLFSESQGRILISVAQKSISVFEKMIKNIPHKKLGKVGGNKLIITDKVKIIDVPVKKLYENYHLFSNSMKPEIKLSTPRRDALGEKLTRN